MLLSLGRGFCSKESPDFRFYALYGQERWLEELPQELKSNLSTAACAAGLHTQAGWEAKAVRDTANPGSGCADGGSAGARTDFRGDLRCEQYAYRADRSALDAVQHVHKLISTGHGQIVDADLSSYFDSVPHARLMRSVARRVVDGAMLQLIKMWLEAPAEETDEHRNTHRSTRNRDEGRGTPQGVSDQSFAQ